MSKSSTRTHVSLCIAAYNAADSVGRAIESAINQRQDSSIEIAEILVYDDCSTDNTADIISGYCSSYPLIQLIKGGENRGVGAARQELLEAATGEFLLFFDDDDCSVATRMIDQVSMIKRYEQSGLNNEKPVFSFGLRQRFFPNDHSDVVGHIGQDPSGRGPSGQSIIDGNLLGLPQNIAFSHLATCALAGRVQAFKDCGGFDPAFRRAEDSEFSIRIGLNGGHIIGTSEVVVHQYMSLGSDKSLDLNHQAKLQLLYKHRELIKTHGYYPFLEDWARFRHAILVRRWNRASVLAGTLLLRYPGKTLKRAWTAQRNVGMAKTEAAYLSENRLT